MRTRRRRISLAIAAGFAIVAAWLALRRTGAPPPVACGAGRTEIVVDTTTHVLSLCENGRAVESFWVRFGFGGVGKRAQGDQRTPLGAYPLSAPRGSAKYGTFVPIGYPTEAQRRLGWTGGDVGVHGPDRRLRWLGRLVNALDTTDGCVGLASDAEMQHVSGWLRRTGARAIEVR